MLVSLPPEKVADIQQLALSLLQTQPVTVHLIMSFLGKVNICANGHSQLQRLCHVIQSNMLSFYHSPAHLFSPVHFAFSALSQLEQLSHLQQNPTPLQFPLPDVVIATDAMLEDVPWCCPNIKDLIMDVLIGHVLKGLPHLQLSLWLPRGVCFTDKGSLP